MEINDLLHSLNEVKEQVCSVIKKVQCSSKSEVEEEANALVDECKLILTRVDDLVCDGVSTTKVREKNKNENHPDPKSMFIDLSSEDQEPNKSEQNPVVKCLVVEEDEDDFSNFDFDDFMDSGDNDNAPEPEPTDKTETKRTELENVFNSSHCSTSSNSHKDNSATEFDGLSDEEENQILLGIDDYDLNEIEDPEMNSETTLQEITIAEQKFLQQEKDDTESSQPQDPKYTNVLKRNFGYAKFRPLQWNIIKSVLEDKRDNFVIMSTGYGKSLTFQFPSVFTKRCSVIISPLISLMEDQVLALKASSIEACVLGSSQKNAARTRDEIFDGKYRLIYITPESAVHYIDYFMRLNKDVGIDLFAIDEAHCVSQWGNDFRPSYRKLDVLKKNFPKVPIIAVTATATKKVQVDIIHNLKLHNPNITRTSFDRPNLFLCVNKKSSNPIDDLKKLMKQKGLRYEFEGPTIIYCPTIKSTEALKNVLDDMKVPSSMYHAKLSLSDRQECHKDFLTDKIQVVVATVAFGMGIDKPDVRQVIHYGAPKEIETYYQEIGRAGRDGMPSVCTVVYSDGDFAVIKHLISNNSSKAFMEHKFNMFHKMRQYLTTRDCRRSHLMEKSGVPEQETTVDYSKEAKDLFTAVDVTGNIYGLAVPVLVLMGSSAKKAVKFKSAACHGVGKSKSEKFWKALGHCLIDAGFLKEERMHNCFGESVKMTNKAWTWMKSFKANPDEVKIDISPSDDLLAADPNLRKKPTFLQTESQPLSKADISHLSQFSLTSSTSSRLKASEDVPSSHTTQPPSSPPPPVDPRVASLEKDLYLKLLHIRDEIFKETGFTPHSIASNKMLLDMAKIRPSSLSKLLQIEDFSQVKVERFGQKFIALINSFCKENSIDVDNFPQNNADKEWKENVDVKTKIYKLTTTQQESYQLFMLCNNKLEDVASKRGLKTSTIVSHLCDAILVGLDVDIQRLGITQHHKDLITRTIWGNPINGDISSLTSIKDRLPPNVEYNHVKLVIAKLTEQYGKELNANGKWSLQRPKNEAVLSPMPSSPFQSLKRSGSDLSPVTDSPLPNKMHKTMSSPPTTVSSTIPSDDFTTSTTQSTMPARDVDLIADSQTTQNQPQIKRSGSTDKTGRSLPSWMQAATSKNVFKKKIKSNSLFK